MTLKEQLIQELNNSPEPVLEQMFNFLRLLKNKSQPTSPPEHPLANLTEAERLARINEVLGAWKDDPEIDEIFTQIDHDRHAYHGRQINSLDQ
jgi:hypothetical protein